ncbi:MAG: hypothetical protein EOP35_06090 [Rubrivivax sp.]|nr:MAG: hypothetical protein EOP35_06090 [Rubrivivax sp.]
MAAPPLAELDPMLLAEAKQARADDGVICELKHDGYRLLAQVQGPSVALRSRGGADATGWYPELARDLAGLSRARVVLDGEVVVLDDLGRSDFERLHARSRRRGWYDGADAVVFVAFDVLVHRGKDVRDQPLETRKALLSRLLAKPRPSVLLCQSVPGEHAPQLYRMACELKLEGIVLKRLGSVYTGGEPRTGDWVKVKRPGATPAQRFERGDLTI